MQIIIPWWLSTFSKFFTISCLSRLSARAVWTKHLARSALPKYFRIAAFRHIPAVYSCACLLLIDYVAHTSANLRTMLVWICSTENAKHALRPTARTLKFYLRNIYPTHAPHLGIHRLEKVIQISSDCCPFSVNPTARLLSVLNLAALNCKYLHLYSNEVIKCSNRCSLLQNRYLLLRCMQF